MEGYDYDAAARTVKIEDITSDETNQEILLKIKGKFRIPTFVELYIDPGGTQRSHCYVPGGAHDSGWLGYFIGKNTSLKALYLESNPFEGFNGAIETFCEGVNSNRSLERMRITTIYANLWFMTATLVLGVHASSHGAKSLYQISKGGHAYKHSNGGRTICRNHRRVGCASPTRRA